MLKHLLVLVLAASPVLAQQHPPLVAAEHARALANELSGETSKRTVEALSLHHRMRVSRGYRSAAEHILRQLETFGLTDARIEEFPADGKIFYGTQRSRPAWNVDFAELWELRETEGKWTPALRLASYDAMPLVLAQDSHSGEAEADVVDIGLGTAAEHYAGKAVRGKLVLTSSQPEAVARLAVGTHGAAGILSSAQNQPQAWHGENENLVRWGHLDTFSPHKTFAFMLSLQQARALQARLARGERVRMRATVRAGQQPAAYQIVTATIPGADPKLAAEEIVFSCHLDHPRPGANDNASGCATILEVARAYSKLIAEKRLPRPLRTVRFVWPPEVEGTITFLNARPEVAARIKAAIHMDMVGGGPETKAIFHVTRGPASLPSFINDVAEVITDFVNQQTDRFASTGRADYPLYSMEGGKEALLAQLVEFSRGSDHEVYTERSWAIPAIYLNDWPDRYIHTNADVPAHIDPTKLERAAFIGASTAWFLANLREEDTRAVFEAVKQRSLVRTARTLARLQQLDPAQRPALVRWHRWYEAHVFSSLERFFPLPEWARAERRRFSEMMEELVGPWPEETPATGDRARVYRRNPNVKGPMGAFGYDYFQDKYGAERATRVRLLGYQGQRGGGGDYAYEALNLASKGFNVQRVAEDLGAIYGPVPVELVAEYLEALRSIGVLEPASAPPPSR
jgi:hypothetical protein